MNEELKKKLEAHMAAVETRMLAQEKSEGEIKAELAKVKKDYEALDAKVRERNVSLPGSELSENGKKFNWFKAVRGIATKDWEGAELEKEHFDQTRKRTTQTTLTGTNMGFLVSVEQAREIFTPAIASLVVSQLGATVYNDLVGDLPFPEIASRPELSWGVENVASSESNVDTGERVMRPKTGKMLVKLSNKLNHQSAQVAEQGVREQIELGVRLGIDKGAIVGTGANSQPLGIMNVAGISQATVVAGSTNRFKFDNAEQLSAAVMDRNYTPNGLLTHPRVISGMKRERVQQYSDDSGGFPLLNPLMTVKALSDMLQLTIAHTTQIPAITGGVANDRRVLVGDFKELKVGYWGGIQLASSDVAGTAFEKNELWIRVFVDMDTLVAHTEAFEMAIDASIVESDWTDAT
jgi:HK97 family phage major capsid protein